MALTKCPDCGSDVSTEAPACPKCGRPNTQTTKRNSPLRTGCGAIVLAIFAFTIIGMIFSGGNDNSSGSSSFSSAVTPSRPVAPSRPIQTYTAKQLYAMFHANEVKANRKIGNAIVRFTGTIASIEQSDFSKTPELQIRANCFNPGDCQDPDAWNTFEADLKESELSAAADLVKGQRITLQCNHVSMPLEVFAEGCTIVRESRHSPRPR